MERNVGFTIVFTYITRREALPEKVSIHTDEMKALKIALKEANKREEKDG